MMERTGLILTGGGAHAAYQAGVLDGIREMLLAAGWPRTRNPFPVVCGTSAGAINGAALAAGSLDWAGAVERLVETWDTMHAGRVYRVDLAGSVGNALHWLAAVALGWMVRSAPRSLFDNRPLVQLLAQTVGEDLVQRSLDAGALHALGVTVSSYTSGLHVTYYQAGAEVAPWQRTQRLAEPARIGIDHLLASSAIPFVFPAVPLTVQGRQEFFGDGTIRQFAPLSPAIHLGADRILAVGAGQLARRPAGAPEGGEQHRYPSLAQIAGHAMAGIFLDGLTGDVERLRRINRTLELVSPAQRGSLGLRHVELLVIAPSQRLDTLAAEHVGALPATTRSLLRVLGATHGRGAALSSYLLFERPYTRRLIALGRSDAHAHRDALLRFFGILSRPAPADAAVGT